MSIQLLKSEKEFRQKIAGLINDEIQQDDESIKQKCIDFISLLPLFFSDSLDRKTLWDRTSNGIYTASSKCNNDFEIFINFILEYIKAEGSKVASNKEFNNFLLYVDEQSNEWKIKFISICQNKYYLLTAYARKKWEDRKKKDKCIKEKDKKIF
jgi:hypothetical protein